MIEQIKLAKDDFEMAKSRLESCINNTPEDKLRWSPSETARTPLQLVACGALGTAGMLRAFLGESFPYENMQEMDAASRAKEKTVNSRDEALKLLDQTSKEFLAWLDTLTEVQLKSKAKMPMGDIPMVVAITYPAGHLHCRACQLDYVQTIYGDLNWNAE